MCRITTQIKAATAVLAILSLLGTAQAGFQTLSVEMKLTSNDVANSQPLVRVQRHMFKAEFTLDGQSNGIAEGHDPIWIAGGDNPIWIIRIPANTLMQTSKTLWSASFADSKSILDSGIRMGIEHGDQTYDDLLGNIRYLDITLKRKGATWQLEIESTGFFEEGTPDWFITGATVLTEVSIGDDIGSQRSNIVEYGGGISH